MKKQFFYLASETEDLFSSAGLNNFEALWNANITLVDEPNRAGDGWSEVGVLVLTDTAGQEQRFYLKRQYNYNCRRQENPLRSIPEGIREWLNIQALDRASIATMDVACCARDSVRGTDRALFATRALEDYQDLTQWWSANRSAEQKTMALQAIGRLIARLHNAGYKHGCLYPKHVYIADANPDDIRLIDLEKCKRIFSKRGSLRDLDTLLRRYADFTNEDQQQLLSAYIAESAANWSLPALQKAVAGRMAAKAS